MKLGESRALDQWDASVDSNPMPVVTLRNRIRHDQAIDSGSLSYAKILQNHGIPVANKERLAVKREVDSVSTSPINKEFTQDIKKVKNNTKSVEAKTGRSEKTFSIHHKPDLHSNKTRYKSGPRPRTRPDLSVHTTGVPEKGFSMDSNRKLNLTGSYGVLKLLSKENLVRIVNSQMQNVPSLSFPSKGSRSRKRDLIDVNHGQLEALKVQRQDIAVTLSHAGIDNQTAFPYVSPVTTPDLSPDQSADSRTNPLSEVAPLSSKGQDSTGIQGLDRGDKSKHIPHSLSAPQSEVSLSAERDITISHTESPFTSTKHLPLYVPSETNDSPPSVLTMQPQGERPGSRAADSHRDALKESVHTAQTEVSTPQYSADEDNKPINSSHVLRLHPAPEWSPDATESVSPGADLQPENGKGLVFEEAESEVEEEVRDHVERRGPRSRSRRSWIWNQFFVIEEYAGPEPVLIGRVRNKTKLIYHLQGL